MSLPGASHYDCHYSDRYNVTMHRILENIKKIEIIYNNRGVKLGLK